MKNLNLRFCVRDSSVDGAVDSLLTSIFNQNNLLICSFSPILTVILTILDPYFDYFLNK